MSTKHDDILTASFQFFKKGIALSPPPTIRGALHDDSVTTNRTNLRLGAKLYRYYREEAEKRTDVRSKNLDKSN